MALEPCLREPAHFGGNLRQGKDAFAGLPIDAEQLEAGAGGEGEEPRTNKRCVLTLISANEACTEPVL